ncbi:MAG: hypothetical protein M0D55_15400 [Elusimicrobiota bacterium]|nr:MAG: hypothetical protein M0D55_15400 [Elusimicrobiota bacterium]
MREVRALKRRDGKDYAGSSAVFFSDHIDNSYTHVDAGDEALEKGDVKTAVKEADLALAANPANADALVLRAGARYEAGDKAAAVADAQAALVLDPSNRQAQAILSLSSKPSGAGLAAFSAATAALGGDGRSDALPADVIVTDDVPASGRLAPTATPAVGRLLSADLSVRAVERAGQNPRESARELGLAVALDPSNASARGWHSTMANRTGDYGAALGSAERAIAADPKDGLAYFNKAFALAGAGDKKGMVTALEQAAQADPAYEGALRQAQGMDDDFLQHLFEDPANARQPEVPQPRHPQASPLLMILCALGAALALGGGAIFFWPNRRSGPELVGR